MLDLRRALVLSLNFATWAGLLLWAAGILSVNGWTLVDGLIFLGIVFGTPWAVLGFWNALIGLWLLHGARDSHSRRGAIPCRGGRQRRP